MTRNPDVFNKAQTEIDRVVGRDRMPTFEDRETLPYLNAVLQEIYRCVQVVDSGQHAHTDMILGGPLDYPFVRTWS